MTRASARVTYRVVVTGLVQGVGFRASMKETATLLAVDGWVRNSPEGAVEAVVQGDEDRVERLLAWAGVGPPGARVESVARERLDGLPRQAGFRVMATRLE